MKDYTELIVKTVGSVLVVTIVGVTLLVAGLYDRGLLANLVGPIMFIGLAALYAINVIKGQ